MGMKYFVTGATGLIGGRVARQLAQAGHEVVALARAPEKAIDLARLGVRVCQGDVTEKESLRAPMTGVDGVFHIAAWRKIGARDKSQAERINVAGTRNVLEMIRELRIPKSVYTSSVAIFSDTHGRLVDETYRYDGPHLSEYDRTKWRAYYEVAEPMMQAGLPLVVVLPALVYGPGEASPISPMLTRYLRRRLPIVPQQAASCWAHVDDIARGHLLAMDNGAPGESYILGGPLHSFIEVIDLAEQITGIPAPRLHLAPGMMRALAALMGAIGAVFPLPDIYNAETLRCCAGVTYLGSDEKARRALGFTVRPLAEGLRETLDYDMKALGIAPRRR